LYHYLLLKEATRDKKNPLSMISRLASPDINTVFAAAFRRPKTQRQ